MVNSVRFNNKLQKEFAMTLKQRVDDYFKTNNRSKFGGSRIILKAILLTTMYLGAYALILTNQFNVYIMWAFTGVMGIGAAGIGMAFMHDANHESFSANKGLNKFFSFSLELLGGSSMNWRIQHNVLHHTYTNIEELDEDVSSRALYRFTKGAKHYKMHRFQHIYMFFLYTLMTYSWIVVADFFQLHRYYKAGLLGPNRSFGKELARLIVGKMFYYSYMVVLPLILVDITWWQLIIGFSTVHFILGFILAVTFQLAHLVEKTDFPDPIDDQIDENWYVHQLATTADFAQHNKILTWYVGGLNYQVEHHLFPHVSHVHYPALSKIVKETTDEFKVRYNVYKNIPEALASHVRMLVRLGKAPVSA